MSLKRRLADPSSVSHVLVVNGRRRRRCVVRYFRIFFTRVSCHRKTTQYFRNFSFTFSVAFLKSTEANDQLTSSSPLFVPLSAVQRDQNSRVDANGRRGVEK